LSRRGVAKAEEAAARARPFGPRVPQIISPLARERFMTQIYHTYMVMQLKMKNKVKNNAHESQGLARSMLPKEVAPAALPGIEMRPRPRAHPTF
jgi:hypothetical protein